jgi:hypothetical protein
MKGEDLCFTKEGLMYKYGSAIPLDEANMKSVGGKKFKSLESALNDLKKELQKKQEDA